MNFRVEWFLKNNLGAFHVVVDYYGTSNTKFYFDLLIFHPAHGKRRTQKKPLKSLKRPKISKNKYYLTFLKVSPETKCFPYFIIKLKMISPFLKNKKQYLTNSKFKFYFWQSFFDARWRFLQISEFVHGLCDFLKMNTHTRQNSQIFWNWTHENIANQ